MKWNNKLFGLFFVFAYISAQQTCYNDNFSDFCGYGTTTEVVVPNLVQVSGPALYYLNLDNSECESWGAGGCILNDEFFTYGLGGDTMNTYQEYYINSTSLVNLSFLIYQYVDNPYNVNITYYNGNNIVDFQTVNYTGICEVPNFYSYNATSPITSFTIEGDYFVIANFTICIAECGSPLLFTGDDVCTPLSNQCSHCVDGLGIDYWYTANCTTSSDDNSCHCNSYLYSESNCQGDVFVSSLTPSTCSYLDNFFPSSSSVCVPFFQAPQNYNINLYSGGASHSCSQVQQNQCITCSEFGENYSFEVVCSATQDPPCIVSQYSSTTCTGTPTKNPVINADCDQLQSIYGSSSVCVFGYTDV